MIKNQLAIKKISVNWWTWLQLGTSYLNRGSLDVSALAFCSSELVANFWLMATEKGVSRCANLSARKRVASYVSKV
jgi:hypothetical protein